MNTMTFSQNFRVKQTIFLTNTKKSPFLKKLRRLIVLRFNFPQYSGLITPLPRRHLQNASFFHGYSYTKAISQILLIILLYTSLLLVI